MTVCPGKTKSPSKISPPVWSESLLCTHWVAKEPSFLHTDSEDSDQTGWMPRLIWGFTGRTWPFCWFWRLKCGSGLELQHHNMSHLMRLWYLSHWRPAKAQASLRIRAVSTEPSLFAHMKYGSRRRDRQKIRHLAPVDGCACTFEEWVYRGWKVSFCCQNVSFLCFFLSKVLTSIS